MSALVYIPALTTLAYKVPACVGTGTRTIVLADEKAVWLPDKTLVMMDGTEYQLVGCNSASPMFLPWYERYLMVIKRRSGQSPVYIPNRDCQLTDWLPPINATNQLDLDTDSWFDVTFRSNPGRDKVKTYKKIVPIIPKESYDQQMKGIKRRKSNKKPVFIVTDQIRIYPTIDQKAILDDWFRCFAMMFNETVIYIRNKIYSDGKLDTNKAKGIVDFHKVRRKLSTKKNAIYQSIPKNPLPSHILDEAINQAVANYKSCLTNLVRGNIKKFRLREWSFRKRRRILKIEPNYFRSGTFCPATIGAMASSEPIENIDRTVTLQYDSDTMKYILFIPMAEPVEKIKKLKLDCGIDPGVRTFATVYSKAGTYAVCNNGSDYIKIRRCNKKIDKIHELLSDSTTSDSSVDDIRDDIQKVPLKRALRKYHKKISDLVKDMHYKAALMLVHRFDNIYIGKFNTRSILSKNNVSISRKTKRTISILSPYLFRLRLTHMGFKYGTNVEAVDEMLTTRTCSQCGILNTLGALKVHKCNCGMISDRDENAAKNILKVAYKAQIEEEQGQARLAEKEAQRVAKKKATLKASKKASIKGSKKVGIKILKSSSTKSSKQSNTKGSKKAGIKVPKSSSTKSSKKSSTKSSSTKSSKKSSTKSSKKFSAKSSKRSSKTSAKKKSQPVNDIANVVTV